MLQGAPRTYPERNGNVQGEAKGVIHRRALLTGLAGFIAAPALVRAASLDYVPRARSQMFTLTVSQGALPYAYEYRYGDGEWIPLRPSQIVRGNCPIEIRHHPHRLIRSTSPRAGLWSSL
jgi:hypothetical protein